MSKLSDYRNKGWKIATNGKPRTLFQVNVFNLQKLILELIIVHGSLEIEASISNKACNGSGAAVTGRPTTK